MQLLCHKNAIVILWFRNSYAVYNENSSIAMFKAKCRNFCY